MRMYAQTHTSAIPNLSMPLSVTLAPLVRKGPSGGLLLQGVDRTGARCRPHASVGVVAPRMILYPGGGVSALTPSFQRITCSPLSFPSCGERSVLLGENPRAEIPSD